MRMLRATLVAPPLTLFAIAASAPVIAQEPTVIKGEAILAHPVGKLAIQTAELLAAGRSRRPFAFGPSRTRRNGRRNRLPSARR